MPSSAPLEGVRAIFFDLDDTLCGYWDASKAGLRAAFVDHPVDGFTTEQAIQHWAVAFRAFCGSLKQTPWYEGYLDEGGPTRTETMRLALERMGCFDPDHAERLSEAYMRHRDANFRPFPGALDVLERLSGRYPLGLMTNGPADIQRQEVATAGIERFFNHFLIEGELRVGKPRPEVFERAEALTGLSGADVLMVGNSYYHDIRPAITRGWRTTWVRRPSDVPPSLEGENPLPEQLPEGAPAPTVEIVEIPELLIHLGLS